MKRKIYLIGLIILVSLVLGACAAPGPAAPQSAGEQPAEQEPAAEPAAEEEKAEPRRVVVAQGTGVESWDPPAGWISASEWIEMNVYDCLVFSDRETGEVTGWLAETWENIDDVTWRMNLRKGVKFHDGSDFTAEDAKFSIDRSE